jgi:hypothetical protein
VAPAHEICPVRSLLVAIIDDEALCSSVVDLMRSVVIAPNRLQPSLLGESAMSAFKDAPSVKAAPLICRMRGIGFALNKRRSR